MTASSKKGPGERRAPGRALYQVFSTRAQRYLYDTATNQILAISEDFAGYRENATLSSAELEELAGDARCGALVPTSALPMPHGLTRATVRSAIANECKQVVLETTRDCNLRCKYCVYTRRRAGKRSTSSQDMPAETALRAVDYLQAHSSRQTKVFVAFYGGEPLLKLPLIRTIAEYARRVILGKDLKFTVTTNGTLLNRESMDFLAAEGFSTLVSLDGPRETHDLNRVFAGSGKGSFDLVASKLREFRKLHPEYCRRSVRLSMVAAPGADYARLAEWVSRQGLSAASVARVRDHTGEYARAYQEQPLAGIEHLRSQFIEAGGRGRLHEPRGRLRFSVHAALFSRPTGLIKMRSVPTSPRDRTIGRGTCIPGRDKLFVGCDGYLFPCEKTKGGQHLSLGHLDSGVDVQKAYDIIVRFHEFRVQECSSCWVWRLCRMCFLGPTVGNAYERDQARRACDAYRSEMTEALKTYCSILERNPHGLDFFLDEDQESAELP